MVSFCFEIGPASELGMLSLASPGRRQDVDVLEVQAA